MRIATYLNERGEVADFGQSGEICLFEGAIGEWVGNSVAPLDLGGMASLSELRARLREACTPIHDCRSFLVGETGGILNAFLEGLGFATWYSEGSLAERLDNVARREAEREQIGGSSRGEGEEEDFTAAPRIHRPSPVGDPKEGAYRIDLSTALEEQPGINSKQILIPFLAERDFSRLEIYCDHLPRWLERKAAELGLSLVIESARGSGTGLVARLSAPEANKKGAR
jgi:Fe-only nitrogenase accessory protein AnfO